MLQTSKTYIQRAKSVVAISKGPNADENVRTALSLCNWPEEGTLGGKLILVKPNLTGGSPARVGETTTLGITDALVRFLIFRGAEVVIGEGGSGIFSATTNFLRSGYAAHFRKAGVQLIDLSRTESRRVPLPNSTLTVPIPKIALDCDAIVSIPVLKLHYLTRVSFGLKNIGVGILAMSCKAVYHDVLDELIPAVNAIVTPKLTVMDGMWGLEGTGPFHGRPVELNMVVASTDPVAVDALCCRLIGLDATTVPHIMGAHQRSLGSLNPVVIGFPPELTERKFHCTWENPFLIT